MRNAPLKAPYADNRAAGLHTVMRTVTAKDALDSYKHFETSVGFNSREHAKLFKKYASNTTSNSPKQLNSNERMDEWRNKIGKSEMHGNRRYLKNL